MTCLAAIRKLLERDWPKRQLFRPSTPPGGANGPSGAALMALPQQLAVELLNVCHRLLLTRESLTLQNQVMKVRGVWLMVSKGLVRRLQAAHLVGGHS
jgi:hypothetical protein